jgi:glycosyltransferase involved in cell wall biosynthesis
MSTYNGEDYVEQSIQSILAQSVSSLELIVVDDCSSDSTTAIVARIADQDARIRLLTTEKNSGGPATPKNFGIRHAKGTYICFQDQDDVALPDKLDILGQRLDRRPEFGAAFGDFLFIDSSGKREETPYLKKRGYIEASKNHLVSLSENLYDCGNRYYGFMASRIIGLSTQGIMIRRSTLQSLSTWFPEDLKICDDLALWFKLAETCRLLFVDTTVSLYRVHANNTSGNSLSLNLDALEFHIRNHRHLSDKLNSSENKAYKRLIRKLRTRLGSDYISAGDKTRGIPILVRSLIERPNLLAAKGLIKGLLGYSAGK